MKKLLLLFLLLTNVQNVQSQIKGNLKLLAGQELKLVGYNDFTSELLSITNIDKLGNFTLIYPDSYKGIAILKAKDNSSLAFILTEKGLKITGSDLKEKENLTFTKSKENSVLIQYFRDYSQRISSLSAWNYLKKNYETESIFKNKRSVLNNINQEIIRIEKEDLNYLNTLNKTSYASWYLPLKKMVIEMPNVVKHNKDKISETIEKFRTINFNDSNFKTSGLLKELIEGHYMLLENSGYKIDSIYYQMNKSSKYILDNLGHNESLLNKTSTYLFNHLERRSLYKSSEYLAVSLLSSNSCSLEGELTKKLEAYRLLKTGSTAPDIIFSDQTKLSNISSKKLLVFGASWCQKCKEDLLKLKKSYAEWEQLGLKIIYISIDTNKSDFEKNYKNLPWRTECSFMGMDEQAVKDYHIFATPSYFLLDEESKILIRPKSIEQINSWIKHNSTK